MTQYISKVIEAFPKEIVGKAVTPAGDHLFKVREDGQKLDEEQVDAFHNTVYQLLFAANHARRDIQMAVSFLTMHVKEPDKDDWGKLKCISEISEWDTILKANIMRGSAQIYRPLVR
jgi:hypothetical protein